MSERSDPTEASASTAYEIRVAGHLSPRWTSWFEDSAVRSQPDGTTTITGRVLDQAALHGLLQKLRDLGIPIVSLTAVPTNPDQEH